MPGPSTPGQRILPGAPVPLFERLVDTRPSAPFEADVSPPLSRDGLILSIATEVSALLNTRSPRSREDLAARPRTTVDYGIPDLSAFQPFDSESESALAAEMEAAIAAFEPRLVNPRVRIHRLDTARRSAFLQEWSERTGRLPANEALRRQGAFVSILPDEHDRRSLLVELSGRIEVEGRIQPISFPVVVFCSLGEHNAAA